MAINQLASHTWYQYVHREGSPFIGYHDCCIIMLTVCLCIEHIMVTIVYSTNRPYVMHTYYAAMLYVYSTSLLNSKNIFTQLLGIIMALASNSVSTDC